MSRWLSTALPVFLLTVLSGFLLTEMILPKIYTATAQIQDSYGFPPSVIESSFARDEDPGDTLKKWFTSESERIRSDIVLKAVAEQLHPAFIPAGYPPEAILTRLRGMIKLKALPGTNIIEITSSGDTPQEAADIANAVAGQYKILAGADQDQRDRRGIEAVRKQMAAEQELLEIKNEVVEKLNSELSANSAIISSSDGDPAAGKLTTFRQAQKDLSQQKNIVLAYGIRLAQVIADRRFDEDIVKITAPAEKQEFPSSPDKLLCFLASILSGLILGSLSAILLERALPRRSNRVVSL